MSGSHSLCSGLTEREVGYGTRLTHERVDEVVVMAVESQAWVGGTDEGIRRKGVFYSGGLWSLSSGRLRKDLISTSRVESSTPFLLPFT